jgi:amidase
VCGGFLNSTDPMIYRTWLKSLSLASAALTLALAVLSAGAAQFQLRNASLRDIQAAFESGALTSERLVQLYLNRIEAYDQKGPSIKAVLALNPKALETARALDAERRAKGPRSPLHGIPVIAKDVFDTADMPTSGGFKAMADAQPTKDAFIIAKLREAGAIILAKVNQSDWYGATDIIASSSLGGSSLNPHALDRTPGWSSSGTSAGLAAYFAPVGLGSETGFSIRTPTSDGNLCGISTTSGLISRDGQMWSYITGERGGPMARSVYDVAAMLDVVAGFDSADLWTAQSLGKMPLEPYTSFVVTNGLRGARLGVLKEAYDFKPVEDGAVELFDKAYAAIEKAGAQVVRGVSLGIDLPRYLTNASPSRYERVDAINRYLARQGPTAKFKNVQEMIANTIHPVRPEIIQAASKPRDLNRDPEYRAALEAKAALKEMLIELMDRYRLDALIYPHKLHGPLLIGHRDAPTSKYQPNQTSPVTGLPAFIVPAGFTPAGLPIGLEILGRPWTEPKLLRVAAGFEAVYPQRRTPATTPALPGEDFEY